MLEAVGFGNFSYYQTIFDYPDKLNAVEEQLEGFGKGGFVVIGSIKNQ